MIIIINIGDTMLNPDSACCSQTLLLIATRTKYAHNGMTLDLILAPDHCYIPQSLMSSTSTPYGYKDTSFNHHTSYSVQGTRSLVTSQD